MTQNVKNPSGPTKHCIGCSVCISLAFRYDVKISASCLVDIVLCVLQVSDGDAKSPRLRTVHDTLADIFKKIGSKENTREVCKL